MRTHKTIIAITAFAAILSGGCAHYREFQPQVDPETYSETQFLHYLGTVPTVTFAEGCKAMVIAADGADHFSSHDERFDALRTRGIVRDDWKLDANQSLDVSTMAFMATKICSLRPSVCSTIFGSWGLGDRRYAHKQAAAADLIPYEPSYKFVTGGELLYTVAKIDDHLAKRDAENASEEINAPSDVAAP
ncbi:MAG TPA: hypothetical protein PKN33_19165 [Phycisphaerae bacterium]|nr:hypothetical protein [Phycisphaerae bacterium]